MKDVFTVRGVPTIELYDRFGDLKQSLTQDNLIVDTGKNYFLRKIFNQFSGTEFDLDIIALGSGTTAPTLSDTSLETQFATATVNSYAFETNNEIVVIAGFIQGSGTGTINELGLLASDDTLISRIVVDTPFDKTATDFLNVSWTFQIG